MRVLLVVKQTEIEPLGAMYLSAVAKRGGWESKVCSFSDAFRVFGEWSPDVVGYSVMTGDQVRFKELDDALHCTAKIRSVFGGPHPTFFPEDFEGREVIKGEGEFAFASYLGFELDRVPWPDREDFPKRRISDFIASRGCPYDCSFCYNKKWSEICGGKRVRTRAVDDVIAEIESVAPVFAYFQDSCFGLDLSWLGEFAEKYPKIPFHCHLRPEQATKERIALLKKAGCRSVRIALETFSSTLRGLLNRDKADGRMVYNASEICAEHGINMMIQNMIGLPSGTIGDDLRTLKWNIWCHPVYSWVSIYQPYPGTELGDYCVKEGLYSGDYSDLSDCFFDTSYLNISKEYREQLECLQKVWALCVETGVMPDERDLTKDRVLHFIHKAMRQQGDARLYG